MSALMHIQILALLATALLLNACGTKPKKSLSREDGLPSHVPVDVARVPDAVPKKEAKSRYGNPPTYVVFGKRYYVMKTNREYSVRGIASWYGTKFHGRKTSNGEPYDMYAMTAAHKTLPLPTFLRVTNLDNNRSIIVRVNDRGPFVDNRIIDLSYTGAYKLGMLKKGTAFVEISAIQPGETDLPVMAKRTPQRDAIVIADHEVVDEIDEKNEPKSKMVAKLPDFDTVRPIEPRKSNLSTTSKAFVPPTTKPDIEESTPASKVKLFLQVGAFQDHGNAKRLYQRLASLSYPSVNILQTHHNSQLYYRVRIGPLRNVEQADKLTSDLNAHGYTGARVIID